MGKHRKKQLEPTPLPTVVVVPAYAILGATEYFSYRMGSEVDILSTAVLTVVLTAVLYADFKSLRWRSLGVRLDARKAQKKERRSKRGRKRSKGRKALLGTT